MAGSVVSVVHVSKNDVAGAKIRVSIVHQLSAYCIRSINENEYIYLLDNMLTYCIYTSTQRPLQLSKTLRFLPYMIHARYA